MFKIQHIHVTPKYEKFWFHFVLSDSVVVSFCNVGFMCDFIRLYRARTTTLEGVNLDTMCEHISEFSRFTTTGPRSGPDMVVIIHNIA